jgi:MFS family permease
MKAIRRVFEYVTINIHYLGLTALSQTMTPLVIPLLVQHFVGEDQKATYYGNLRLWSLMVALLVQALMGTLSDRNHSRWGRRRPFILLGTSLNVVIVILIGYSATLHGSSGYWFLFVLALMMMAAANISHSAQQSLIPDLIPVERRGVASGIKAIMEVPLPLVLVAGFIGPALARGNYWLALLIMLVTLVGTALITMLVKETPLTSPALALNFRPFLRLTLMAGVFTLIILSMGAIIRFVARLSTHNLSLSAALWIFGILGIILICVAVMLGVLLSIRISLGEITSASNHAFSWWVVNRLFFLVGSTNLASFAIFFLQSRLGYSQEDAAEPASRMMLFVGIFILLTALPGGWLADRLGHKPLVATSGLVAAAGTVTVMAAKDISAIYIGAVLVGIATGIFYTTNWSLGTKLVPNHEPGRYLGISNLAGAGAGAIGAYLGGPIADFFTINYPSYPGFGYVLLFGVYGMLFLFSVLSLYQVKIPPIQQTTM